MTIRIFVGTGANGEDAESCMVLEATLRKHASAPLEIVWMRLSNDPTSFWSGWDTSRWATPFSGFRWALPAYCGFAGRAIYMDSDMIACADIAELWNTPLETGRIIAARGDWRFCVCLWDCAAAQPFLPPLPLLRTADGHRGMAQHFRSRRDLVQPFDAPWNYCDSEDFGPLSEAKIVHYTDMATQPHLRYAIPRLELNGWRHWYDGPLRPHPRPEIVDLFDVEFLNAYDAGYDLETYIPAERYGPYRKASLRNYRGRA